VLALAAKFGDFYNPSVQSIWVAVCAAQLMSGIARAEEAADGGPARAPSPVPGALSVMPQPTIDATQALYGALHLPLHIGDAWQENLNRLWGMRCLPEDSALFSAMDCRSDLVLGPFSAQEPEGDGLSLISDDDGALSRVKSTRLTPWTHQDCERFQVGVTQALAQAGVASTVEHFRGATRVRAGAPGDIQLTVDCRPTVQTLEVADAWVYLVPGGNCPGLALAPSDLRALADSAMTGTVHDNFEELGTACNHPGYHVGEYTGQLMNGLMAAYTVRGGSIPSVAPEWLLTQIRTGLANVRREGASLRPDSRRRFQAFLDREESPTRLSSLWSAVRKNRSTVRADQSPGDHKASRSRH
jgi:hypothetical protein